MPTNFYNNNLQLTTVIFEYKTLFKNILGQNFYQMFSLCMFARLRLLQFDCVRFFLDKQEWHENYKFNAA